MTSPGRLATDLASFVAMPTVSSPAPDRAALATAASWLARQLTALGARVTTRSAGGAPMVLGERHGPLGAPTLLCYGHFDVVAPGARRSWSVPPFAGIRRAGLLFGRGAADDKGPVLAQLQAARTSHAVSWKFLYDGAEELGSPALGPLLRRLRPWLRDVDAVLICDTEARADGRPTLTCSLRGQLSFELRTRRDGPALHAGRYGGAAPNPAQALAQLIASLHHLDGGIAVPGFTDGVRALPPLGVAELDRRLAPVAHPGWGAPGRTAAEQVTVHPALVVNALCAGDCGPGPWHVIPTTAAAKIDVRLVPDQRPGTVFQRISTHLIGLAPAGITVELQRSAAGWPWALATAPGPAVCAAAEAIAQVWGQPPALVRSGGTIPAASLLARAAPWAEVVLLGFTLPGDNAHGPDEHVDLARLEAAAATIGRLTEILAGEP